jgi:hypothetical protein
MGDGQGGCWGWPLHARAAGSGLVWQEGAGDGRGQAGRGISV